MNPKIIFENENLIVLDKPAGIPVYSESPKETSLIENLIKKYPYLKNVGNPPRYGIIHRLDRETSGILLVAKNNQSLAWFQEQFKENLAPKKYIALVVGIIEETEGEIKTLIGRSKKDFRKQKVYLYGEPESKGKREAITQYRVLKRYSATGGSAAGGKDYTLIEVFPRTGRMHQIRVHFANIHHPVVGDKKYGLGNQPCPEGLKRQFLHASSIKIKMPNNEIKEFESQLPKDLQIILDGLNL